MSKITIELTKSEMIHIMTSMHGEVLRLREKGLNVTSDAYRKDLSYISTQYALKWKHEPIRKSFFKES